MPPPPSLTPFPLLHLPPELRLEIYTHHARRPFHHPFPIHSPTARRRADFSTKLPLLLACRQLHAEALPILYAHHDFSFTVLGASRRRRVFAYESFGDEDDDAGGRDPGVDFLFRGCWAGEVVVAPPVAMLRHVRLVVGFSAVAAQICGPGGVGVGEGGDAVVDALEVLVRRCPNLRSLRLELEGEMEMVWGRALEVLLGWGSRERVARLVRVLVGRCGRVEVAMGAGGEEVRGWVGAIADEGRWVKKVLVGEGEEGEEGCIYTLDCGGVAGENRGYSLL